MEASGGPQPPQEPPPQASSEPQTPADTVAPMSEEGLGNSGTAHAHAGDAGDPANRSGDEAGPVDEEGTDALTVVGPAAGLRTVIGARSDRLSKQYLQRSTELRGQCRQTGSLRSAV